MLEFATRCFIEPVPSLVRYVVIRRLFAISTLILVAATGKLWFPITEFPMVPLTALACPVPVVADWILSITLVVLLIAWSVIRAKSRFAVVIPASIVVCLSGLIMLNQHRAQPWAYLAALACVIFVGLAPAKTFAGLRLLFISVYFYSAISKFDYLYVQKMGQLFVKTGLEILRINPGLVSDQVKLALVFGIPLFELLTAFALALPSTRRFGMPMAILMHVGLLVLLGPWGLNHKPAVLIWNIFFILCVYILFNRSFQDDSEELDVGYNKTALLRFGSMGILTFVLIAPAFASFGYWEQWPSWSLYADRTEKVELFVRRDRLVDLPIAVRPYFGPSGSNDNWSKLYVEAWAIGETDAPAYPQSRFYLGTAIDLAQRCELGNDIRVNLYGIPHRMNGSRQAESIVGQRELIDRAKQYHLNAMPRSVNSKTALDP